MITKTEVENAIGIPLIVGFLLGVAISGFGGQIHGLYLFLATFAAYFLGVFFREWAVNRVYLALNKEIQHERIE